MNTSTSIDYAANVGRRATLRSRVLRRPASLGGYHYYLEPGQVVFITGHAGGIARVSVIESPSERCSEDYFSVPYADLHLEPEAEVISDVAEARSVLLAFTNELLCEMDYTDADL